MATSERTPFESPRSRIGIRRLALTLGVGAFLIFGLCWIGTFFPLSSPTHAYIGLFTTAPAGSIAALVDGSVWSFLFGNLSGAIVAALYNLFDELDRR